MSQLVLLSSTKLLRQMPLGKRDWLGSETAPRLAFPRQGAGPHVNWTRPGTSPKGSVEELKTVLDCLEWPPRKGAEAAPLLPAMLESAPGFEKTRLASLLTGIVEELKTVLAVEGLRLDLRQSRQVGSASASGTPDP